MTSHERDRARVGAEAGAGAEPDDDSVTEPASSSPVLRFRRITSPAVVAAAAATVRPMRALAYRPVRGVSGARILPVMYGAIRLPIPIDRLAKVSASS